MKIWLKQLWCIFWKCHDWHVIDSDVDETGWFYIWQCSKCGKLGKEKI